MKTLEHIIVRSLVLFLVVSFMFGFSYSGQAKMFSKEEIISIVSDYDELYIASKDRVYRTSDSGANWKKIFSIKKAGDRINKIYADPKLNNAIYVLTQYGLFQSRDDGNKWQRLFKGSSDLESNCLSLLATSSALFLGTQGGLLISYNQGRTWQRSFEQFSDSVIPSIVGNSKIIYVAGEKGVFVSEDNGGKWRRIYITYSSEIPSEDFDDSDNQISNQVVNIKGMTLYNERLYIATAKGLLLTENKGGKWESITKIGLSSTDIRSMVVADAKQLYVATEKGIFRLDENRWKRVGGGALYKDFSDLKIDDKGVLLIAGKGGLYRFSVEEGMSESKEADYSKEDIRNLFVGEPTIEQVQAAAIEFAEANMSKIKSWRRQSRFKALLPSFSVGYDKVIYGSYTDRFAVGPKDWDINFSWDLSDLIWSTDQTTIDSRSRLVVQLRQDVLDQVTNLYFERRRLKAEFLLLPPADEVEELYRNFEIQQVTANLDGLTNNFFTRFLQKGAKKRD
ncbi:WD40/YVTN/BNR-like repeat-containing protein [Candidatus Omnitrophota bacterium]